MIEYKQGIKPLPKWAEEIVYRVIDEVKIWKLVITSTVRTPEEQAKAMLNNRATYGLDSQLKLYGPAGDEVLRQTTFDDMVAAIYRIGPEKVSKHCTNDPDLAVFDVRPACLKGKEKEFVSVMGRYGKVIEPPVDPVFHVEIKR